MPITYAQKSSTDQKNADSNAAFVVDSSSQSVSLQRKADMANCANQRVVQRDTGVVQRLGEADGKFMYVPNLQENQFVNEDDRFMNRVPYKSGMICFSKYDGQPLESAGFTGCMMMAFHFNYNGKNGDELDELFCGGLLPYENLDDVSVNDKFIAHIFADDSDNDTKIALFDAEQRNLITIEVVFKPFLSEDGDNIFNVANNDENLRQRHIMKQRAIPDYSFYGRMTLDDDRWNASVFVEDETVYNSIKDKYQPLYTENKKIKHFNSDQLNYQTKLTKIMIYTKAADKYRKLAEPSPDGVSMYELANLYYYKSKEIDIKKQIKEIANDNYDILMDASNLISNSALKRYFIDWICK